MERRRKKKSLGCPLLRPLAVSALDFFFLLHSIFLYQSCISSRILSSLVHTSILEVPMLQKAFVLTFFLAAAALSAAAQDCKLKFSVAYSDGKTIQVGLTTEQKKLWDHDAAKKFKGMCLDDKTPDFIILWNHGLNGAELAHNSVDHANVILSTSQTPQPLRRKPA